MSVSATFVKINNLIAASTAGITTASTSLPATLNAVNLPWAVVIPGPASWNEHADGLYRQLRTYVIRVYVKPVAQGKGVDEGIQACLAPLNAVGRLFLTNYSLDNTVDEVVQPFEDSGILGDLEYAGVPYHGFEFRIQVKEKST